MNNISKDSQNKNERILAAVQQDKQSENTSNSLEIKKIQHVFFTLEPDRYYALSGEAVKEILPIGKINPVFGCPEDILGIINIRGETESVISLHAVLGLASTQISPQSRVLIAGDGRIHSGIFVDIVEDVAEIPEDSLQKVVYKMEPDIAVAETDFNGRHYIVLDTARIFALVEKHCGLQDDTNDGK